MCPPSGFFICQILYTYKQDMGYTHRSNLKSTRRLRQQKQLVIILAAAALMGGGAYTLLLTAAPTFQHFPFTQARWNTPVVFSSGELTGDRLYIPRIKLNILYKSGDASVLNDAAWHRHPERGNPQDGGNFIIAAHRFEIGLTPSETRRKSPFYKIDSLQIGDKMYADYQGRRYAYEVSRKYEVKADQTEIENKSDDAKMTLYSCTLQGSADGREVIEAKKIGEVSPTELF